MVAGLFFFGLGETFASSHRFPRLNRGPWGVFLVVPHPSWEGPFLVRGDKSSRPPKLMSGSSIFSCGCRVVYNTSDGLVANSSSNFSNSDSSLRNFSGFKGNSGTFVKSWDPLSVIDIPTVRSSSFLRSTCSNPFDTSSLVTMESIADVIPRRGRRTEVVTGPASKATSVKITY